MRSMHDEIEAKALIPVTRQTNADTAIVSNIIDLAGYNECEMVIVTGALTDADATFAVTLDEGDVSNLSDAAAVTAADKLGGGTLAAAGFTFAADGAVRKLAYTGVKRYIRMTITPTGNNSGNCDVAAVAILRGAQKQPTP